jgi:hypothetical protein
MKLKWLAGDDCITDVGNPVRHKPEWLLALLTVWSLGMSAGFGNEQ